MEIRKYYLRTDRHRWVGARDMCVSKNTEFLVKYRQNTDKNTDTQEGEFQQYCESCKNIFVQQEGENSSILRNSIHLQ